jgi:hypothetical protein
MDPPDKNETRGCKNKQANKHRMERSFSSLSSSSTGSTFFPATQINKLDFQLGALRHNHQLAPPEETNRSVSFVSS